MKKILCVILCCLMAVPVWATADYKQIDKYAHDAPMLKTTTGLGRLVNYLTRPYKTDEEKARVILAWIVHNIDYDDYKSNAIDDSLDKTKKRNKEMKIAHNDILETRIGVCEDIANLYKKMGEMAGLQVEVVGGNAGYNMTLTEFETGAGHAWNVVKINREWEYVDPTWAMDGDGTSSLGNINKHKEYKKVIKERSKRQSDVKRVREGRFVNDKWFLTDKEEMIKSHFPDDEKWQLQKKKITKKEFLGLDRSEYNKAKRELHRAQRKNVR